MGALIVLTVWLAISLIIAKIENREDEVQEEKHVELVHRKRCSRGMRPRTPASFANKKAG